MRLSVLAFFIALVVQHTPASAGDFTYHRQVTLSVGQSIVLKGVRNRNCGTRVPAWSSVASRLPSSRLGAFSDGGGGTVQSSFCRRTYDIRGVAARGVRFTAKRRGSERLIIFKDPVRITVR